MTPPQPAKVLCSFHFFRDQDMSAYPAMIMADSGAFSAHNAGADVTYDDYTTWIRRWNQQLFCYPTLDVIGDPEATWRNYQRMRRHGLAPLPVYHLHSPLRYLQRYLDAGETYIALGGMVGAPPSRTKSWLIRCFKMAEPYKAVFHGFGRTSISDLRDFPWYSVDSSSHSGAVRYREVMLFNGHRFVYLHRGRPKELYAHGRLLRQHGVTPADMDNRNPRVRALGHRAGVIATRRCEEWLRARHGPVPGPRPGDPPGPHIFLAITNDQAATHVLNAISHMPGPYLRKTTTT